jgi:prepilin-type N-terminal cleavage/methylation domain-containing protein
MGVKKLFQEYTKHNSRYFSKKGFTLIEIIVSLGVFALGILGVMALFPVGLDAQKRALDYSNLVGLAEWKMGDIAYRSHLSESQNSLTADTSYPTGGGDDPEPFTHNKKYAWHYDISQPFMPLTNLYRVDLYIYAIDNNDPIEKVVSYFELPEPD